MIDTKEVVKKEGKVTETQMGGMYRVELEEGVFALATIAGRMRKAHIRVMPGDKVLVEFSPHDLTRGRITYRLKA